MSRQKYALENVHIENAHIKQSPGLQCNIIGKSSKQQPPRTNIRKMFIFSAYRLALVRRVHNHIMPLYVWHVCMAANGSSMLLTEIDYIQCFYMLLAYTSSCLQP